MDSAQQKRMILAQSEMSGVRKKILDAKEGINADDVIEMGQAFEQTVATKGWSFIEAYLLKKCDPTLILFGPEDATQRGEARGAINLMQYIDQTIKAKNELLRKANEKRAVDTPPPSD